MPETPRLPRRYIVGSLLCKQRLILDQKPQHYANTTFSGNENRGWQVGQMVGRTASNVGTIVSSVCHHMRSMLIGLFSKKHNK